MEVFSLSHDTETEESSSKVMEYIDILEKFLS